MSKKKYLSAGFIVLAGAVVVTLVSVASASASGKWGMNKMRDMNPEAF